MSLCPVSYSFCNQTVTVYHREKERISRKVVKNAFLQWRDRLKTDPLGTVRKAEFLLVIPGSTQTVFPGDWVVAGQGPEIPDAAEFRPGTVAGLGQVGQTQCFYWENAICHTEARGE